MINTTVMRAGRNALIGAMLCTTAALAVGTIATSTPDELRTAALVAAQTHSLVPIAAQEQGGPAGEFLASMRQNYVIDDSATAVKLGKDAAQELRKGAARADVSRQVAQRLAQGDVLHTIPANNQYPDTNRDANVLVDYAVQAFTFKDASYATAALVSHGHGPTFRTVGNYADTGATDLGGPNGAYLAELRAAGLSVDDAVGAMRLGRDAIQSIKHSDDPASAYGTAYNEVSVALQAPGAPVSGGGVRFMARQVIAAAVHSFSPDVTGILAESGVTV